MSVSPSYPWARSVIARLERWGTVRTGLLLAALVAAPTLFAGFFVDDYVHLLSLQGKMPGSTSFDLFRFASGNAQEMEQIMGRVPYPWFTFPDIHLH
ncbi:MAG: hypothetical protein HYV26_21000, partial [Candidatus Hydrogenedentes bacterium]|nr:hypothetical protein [Candidatus Hydrogenedentota bacterium]